MTLDHLALLSRREIVRTSLLVIALIAGAVWVSLHFLKPAPPRHIVLASGAEFGLYHQYALRYRAILARFGIDVEVRRSAGSGENFRLLLDPSSGVDVAFLQGGIATFPEADGLVMLASLYYEPLWIFHRDPGTPTKIRELQGKRIATGGPGSGTHAFSLPLLAANGLNPGTATLVPLTGPDALAALQRGEVDAMFYLGGARTAFIQEALRDPSLKLMSLPRADAYQRTFAHISRLTLPEGAVDLALDLPLESVTMIGTKAMLVARDDLHPAIVNLLTDAAREIHWPGRELFETAGEFPEHRSRWTCACRRTRQITGASARPSLYRWLPFWVATLVERAIVMLAADARRGLFPLLSYLPQFLRWRDRSRVYRWYGELALLERDVATRAGHRRRWRNGSPISIASAARSRRSTRRSEFASEAYTLREHVDLVRRAMVAPAGPESRSAASHRPSPAPKEVPSACVFVRLDSRGTRCRRRRHRGRPVAGPAKRGAGARSHGAGGQGRDGALRRRRRLRRLPRRASTRRGTARTTTSRCRSPTSKSVLGDFADAKFAYAGITSTFFRRDGRFFVNTDGPDGKLADYEIKYTFGVRPLQQYLIEFPGGRMQALSIAWDSRPKAQGGQRWFHLYPGQNIKAGDPLHWTGIGQNWNFMCAECHSTNLRKNFDAAASDVQDDVVGAQRRLRGLPRAGVEPRRVGEARRATGRRSTAGKGLAVALDERRGVTWTPVAATGNAVRSAPRAERRARSRPARAATRRASRISDDYVHGKPPLDTHRPALLDDGLYWNDGQMRDEVYNWGSFVQSRMHAAGRHLLGLPRPALAEAAGAGQRGLRAVPPAGEVRRAPTHTHHAAGTPGAGVRGVPHADDDLHGRRPAPRPLDAHSAARRLGEARHAERLQQLPRASSRRSGRPTPSQRWTGRPPASFQNFAEALRGRHRGAPGARGALLGAHRRQVRSRRSSRASAHRRDSGRWLTPGPSTLSSRATERCRRRWCGSPRSRRSRARDAGHAAARAAAAARRSGARGAHRGGARARGRAGAGAAGGAARRVRPRAGRVHRGADVQRRPSRGPDRASATCTPQRGDAAAAIAEYRKALALDPTFVPAYVNLADLYRAPRRRARGRGDAARGARAQPAVAAALRHALGLSLVRAEAHRRGADGTRRGGAGSRPTTRASPTSTPWRSTTRASAGGAATCCGRRVKREPLRPRRADRSRRTSSLQAGDRDEALRYAKRLRELDPESQEHAQLAQRVAGAPAR